LAQHLWSTQENWVKIGVVYKTCLIKFEKFIVFKYECPENLIFSGPANVYFTALKNYNAQLDLIF
jgi:hypothetical protein